MYVSDGRAPWRYHQSMVQQSTDGVHCFAFDALSLSIDPSCHDLQSLIYLYVWIRKWHAALYMGAVSFGVETRRVKIRGRERE